MCSSLLVPRKITGDPGIRTHISTPYYQAPYRITLHWNRKLAEAQVVAGGHLLGKDPGGRETEAAVASLLCSDTIAQHTL